MNKNKQIQNHWMRFKVSTLTASITSLILAGLPAQIQASDIDIYQAGGTGAINIYFMLDVSGSMGSTSLPDDYGHTSVKEDCTIPTYETGYTYTQSNSGSRRVTFIAAKNGTHNKSGNNYIFVGAGKGSYNVVSDNGSGSGTRYGRASTQLQNGTKCENVDFNICPSSWSSSAGGVWLWSGTALSSALSVNGSTYAQTGEAYCLVKESDLNVSITSDATYLTKIKKICEPVVGQTGQYNCLTRLANLKKGFYQLLASSEIGKDHNFALGKYSSTNISTIKNFTSMDADGKSRLTSDVAALVAVGGTPIAGAYKEASSVITAGNTVSNAKSSCSGNGVYFLTDGQPDPATTTEFETVKVNDSDLLYLSGRNNTDYWQRVAGQGQSLRLGKKLVKTATVGFGGDYYLTTTYAKDGDFDCSVYSHPQKGLCLWGTKNRSFGKGGFYNAQSAEDIVGSIKQFINDTTVPIEGSTIGSSTIPVDALNTSQLQPFAYFPMFKPLIETQDQLWVGNLKKYNVIDGSIYDISKTKVFKSTTEFNDSLKDYWLDSTVTHPDQVISYGGNLSQLLGGKMPKVDGSSQRKVFMNSGSSADDLVSAESILEAGTLADREYLYGLLGYSKLTAADLAQLKEKTTYAEQLEYLKTKTNLRGYQLGSIIHSSPILLTQKGTILSDSESVGRDDYVLFGTTQGVLHVVKSGMQNKQVTDGGAVAKDSGTEVFSFVPKEMLAKQKTGFFESMAMDKANGGFYYGIDGPWTAHTAYEPYVTSDNYDGLEVKANSKYSHQYVYGGLRMGGRSYYALNLSDLDKPKLMFHIDPVNAASTSPLSHMGESWSKPTLAYIKWNGKRKLAMIVGGGYDRQYEDPAFKNTTSGAVKGNGVYIFDAENGKLLWWGSSSAEDSVGTATDGAATTIADMVNSIPSRVKTVDRDGDGLVDNLYVGDLGGKVFRIDLNPNHKAADADNKFVLNAFAFADAKESGKNAPRFYEAPTFTIHTNATTAKKYAVVSLVSGDRSSPLQTGSSVAQDMILGFYDTGVTATTLAVGTTITLTGMNEIYKAGATKTGTLGWYYRLPISTGTDGKSSYQVRGLSEGVALDGDLYYSVFDPSKTNNGSNGTSTSCSGGIVGVSTAVKLCLPSGTCGTDTTITTVGDLGGGIISLNVGPGTKKGTRTLIFNHGPYKCDSDGKNCKIVPPPVYETTNKMLSTRWYDMTPFVGAK